MEFIDIMKKMHSEYPEGLLCGKLNNHTFGVIETPIKGHWHRYATIEEDENEIKISCDAYPNLVSDDSKTLVDNIAKFILTYFKKHDIEESYKITIHTKWLSRAGGPAVWNLEEFIEL